MDVTRRRLAGSPRRGPATRRRRGRPDGDAMVKQQLKPG